MLNKKLYLIRAAMSTAKIKKRGKAKIFKKKSLSRVEKRRNMP
jgi:hypothetical protein